jgi:hypothetical protein
MMRIGLWRSVRTGALGQRDTEAGAVVVASEGEGEAEVGIGAGEAILGGGEAFVIPDFVHTINGV